MQLTWNDVNFCRSNIKQIYFLDYDCGRLWRLQRGWFNWLSALVHSGLRWTTISSCQSSGLQGFPDSTALLAMYVESSVTATVQTFTSGLCFRGLREQPPKCSPLNFQPCFNISVQLNYWNFLHPKRSVWRLKSVKRRLRRASAPDSARRVCDAPPDPVLGWGGIPLSIPEIV